MLARTLALSAVASVALSCTAPGSSTDAGADAIPTDLDAGAHGIHWVLGPPLPTPLAYATAQMFPVGASDLYLYVFGGSSASRGSLGIDSSAVYRSRVSGDTLQAWERVGDIAPGGTVQGLVGHASLPINDAMGNPGAAIAGGGSLTRGALPIVLAIYCDTSDGHLFDWSRFPPVLSEGQSFGVFAPFDPFDYALVGGIVNNVHSARVLVAPIRNGATSPDWVVGPSLPAPRSRHAWFVVGQQVYLLGGENNDGTVGDIIRTTRDASGAASGWETVGTIASPPVTHAAFTYRGEAYLVGGIDGTTFDGAASARVRRAPLEPNGHIGEFVDDAESLPMPLAASAFATDFEHYYLVGGMTEPDLTATGAVMIGTIY
jgi:hypothetical protein